ncbi:MAG TPA: phage/plasmid primase, P4 family [Candidatus Limnocylindria bacterium]|nr:phage/plasmid primase, P4 family [Candidatus Limnocylindria bacterium]
MLAHYIQVGWRLVRIPALSKAPIDDDWDEREYQPESFAPGDNVGVKLGPSGLVDIDLDCSEAVVLAPYYLPATATFGRPSKPRSHWIYTCRGARTRRPTRTLVEFRANPRNGGKGIQTVVPPSIHESGEPITWTPGCPAPLVIDEQTLLEAFSKLATATVIARTWTRAQEHRGAHEYALALAGALWREGWSEDDARAVILPAAEIHGGPDTGHREGAIASTFEGDTDRERTGWPTIERIVDVADAKALQKAVALAGKRPRAKLADLVDYPMNDDGNAQRLVAMFAGELIYVPGLEWLRWDGQRWAKTEGPYREAIEAARALAEQGRAQGIEALEKWGLQCGNAARIEAAIRVASHAPEIRREPSQLDADPWCLVVENGELDLRTGELRPHRRETLATKLAPVAWDAHATCPRFDQFLRETLLDQELVLYLLRFLGYALTGTIRDHALGLWHGPQGANGKSTLLGLLSSLLGDYAHTMDARTLLSSRAKDSDAPSPGTAALRGVRLAVAEEVDEGRRWDEALVKRLTGGNRIRTRDLYAKQIEFAPTHKLIVAVNARPRVLGQGDAFWRRVQVVPWVVSFKGREDTELGEKLARERSGILRLLVLGCLSWQRIGLAPPLVVQAHGDEYRRSQDVVGAFVREALAPGSGVSPGDVYARYRFWSSSRGEHTLPASVFERVLDERGIDLVRFRLL